MPEKVYEILALAARYWFALLGVIIVWQSFRWLRRDRREKHRRLRQLPDAGMIGEMVVLEGSDDLPEGTTMPIPREGTLGYLRTCDVVAPVPGVKHQHCDFTFVPGKGLLIFPRSRCVAEVDGELIRRRRDGKMHPMQHGSRLRVGEALLRLRVFVGLEVERRSTVMAEEEEPLPEQAPWQESPYVYHQVPAAWETGPFQPVPPYGQPPYDPSMPYGAPYAPVNDPYAPAQPYPPQYAPYDTNAAYPPQVQPYDPSAAYPQYPPYDPYAPGEADPSGLFDVEQNPAQEAPLPRRRLRRRRDHGEA